MHAVFGAEISGRIIFKRIKNCRIVLDIKKERFFKTINHQKTNGKLLSDLFTRKRFDVLRTFGRQLRRKRQAVFLLSPHFHLNN
jgi:hypothetical protein